MDILMYAPQLLAATTIAFITGYFLRSTETKKAKKRIIELEIDMLATHSQLLKLEAELARKKATTAAATPVISIPTANTPQKKAN